MAQQNLSNFDPVLREFYEGTARSTINNNVVLYRELSESSREWGGRHVRWPVHTTRGNAVGARSENANLPTAQRQGYQESRITAAYNYGRIELSGQVMAADRNAFLDALQSEMQGVTDDLVNDLSRQTWGTGDGRIAQVGADGASASAISLFNRFQKPGQPGARYLEEGQLIELGTVASPSAQSTAVAIVTGGIDISENPATTVDTITISASTVTVSQSDTFVFMDKAGGLGLEMIGMRGLVDHITHANIWGSSAYFGTSVQNIGRDSVARWNSIVLDNSQVARNIDSFLMQKAFDRVETASGKSVSKIMGHHSVARAFFDHLSADRRFAAGPSPLTMDGGGSDNLSYNGVPFVRDRHAPYNELYLMAGEQIKMYTLLDLEFADDDGSVLSRVSNKDAFEAFLRCYKNLGLDDNPRGTLVIRDIKTDL